ncbi:Zinc finger BED domain-containing protein RICESLEEPER 1 [Linum perenne]
MRTMAVKMLEKFNKYWGQCNLVVSFAAVLDPTNKFTIIDVMYPDLYDSGESSYYIGLVREKLTKLYDEHASEFKAKNIENETEPVHETTSTTSSANVQFKVLRGKAAFDSIVENQVSACSGKSELDEYLESVIFKVPKGMDFDVIGWWKEHSLQYKILSRMAVDILVIPITSVASEAAFSAGGRVFSLPLLLLLVPLYMKSLLLTVKCVDCSFLACTVQIDNAEMEMGIGVYKQQSITWIMDGLQNIILTCYC